MTTYDDQHAATAVAALEHMLIDRGVMTPEQVEADILAHRTTRAHAGGGELENDRPPALAASGGQAGGTAINTATGYQPEAATSVTADQRN